jgi:hypothetical protein
MAGGKILYPRLESRLRGSTSMFYFLVLPQASAKGWRSVNSPFGRNNLIGNPC